MKIFEWSFLESDLLIERGFVFGELRSYIAMIIIFLAEGKLRSVEDLINDLSRRYQLHLLFEVFDFSLTIFNIEIRFNILKILLVCLQLS